MKTIIIDNALSKAWDAPLDKKLILKVMDVYWKLKFAMEVTS